MQATKIPAAALKASPASVSEAKMPAATVLAAAQKAPQAPAFKVTTRWPLQFQRRRHRTQQSYVILFPIIPDLSSVWTFAFILYSRSMPVCFVSCLLALLPEILS